MPHLRSSGGGRVVILPTKGVPASKALISVGGEALEALGDSALSMSGLWSRYSEAQTRSGTSPISYDWFVLAIDLLYLLGAVRLNELGLLQRVAS